jgi:cytoskeletal protein CcmA (bactofilin family)
MAKMFAGRPEGASLEAATTIGDGVRVEGKFSGAGNIVVKGEVVGSLKTSEDISIESTARVEADVEANNLTVAGEIHGNVHCRGQLQLLATGKVFGDVSTAVLSVEMGAVINGQCTTGAAAGTGEKAA